MSELALSCGNPLRSGNPLRRRRIPLLSSSFVCGTSLEMSTDVICQLAYDGKLQELQDKLQTDFKLACKKFQVTIVETHPFVVEH